MNETNNSLFTATTGTATLASTGYSGTINGNINSLLTEPSVLGYSGTSITTTTDGTGLTLQGNSTINYSTNQYQSNMTPKQVKVAVFTITRDADTNEITSTTFVKELWVERKNGTSLDLLVAKQLDKDFDPENTVVREIYTVSF
jgi:hypothetical protein